MPYKFYCDELVELFKEAGIQNGYNGIGNVVRADIMENSAGLSRGSGTVLYETVEQAQKAIEIMNGRTVGGRKLEVREVFFKN